MSFKLLITGLIFAYFIIAIHFSFHVESLAEYSNNFSVLSRSKRQIPFFSNWWSSSSTKKPADLRKQGYINSQSKQAGYGHKSFDLSNDKSLSYNNSGITRNEISERDSRCKAINNILNFLVEFENYRLILRIIIVMSVFSFVFVHCHKVWQHWMSKCFRGQWNLLPCQWMSQKGRGSEWEMCKGNLQEQGLYGN